jgi:DNA-binding NarL/FixJ family response regulator
MIRVLIVHDHAATRGRLRSALAAAPGIRVVGHVADADQALVAARGLDPDVIVMALIPRGLDTDAPAERRYAQVPLAIFKPQPGSIDAGRLVHSDALGYLCPAATTLDLVAAVRTVHAGRPFVCPHVRAALKQARPKAGGRSERLDRLTQRELQLLRELAAGKPNREIARALGLSPKTVSTHRMHILAKLGLHSNVELARLAFEHNLLDT